MRKKAEKLRSLPDSRWHVPISVLAVLPEKSCLYPNAWTKTQTHT